MQPGVPSKTAEHNALFRALELAVPKRERIVEDPLAAEFLSWPYRAVVQLARVPGGAAVIRSIIDRRWPGVRTSLVARTRRIDEMVSHVAPSCAQVVILGAGYDTRAWRLDCLRDREGLFEVDHPDTQRRKRRVLERCGQPTSHVRFVATDFHLGRLAAAIAEQGYRRHDSTVFLWEGTTNYLDDTAIDATLRWCAESGPGSQLIFTYINQDVLTDPSRYEGAERMLGTLGRANERMTFGLDPSQLASYLAERGLELESDTGAAQYRAELYGERARSMRGHEFYRVAQARIRVSSRL